MTPGNNVLQFNNFQAGVVDEVDVTDVTDMTDVTDVTDDEDEADVTDDAADDTVEQVTLLPSTGQGSSNDGIGTAGTLAIAALIAAAMAGLWTQLSARRPDQG